MHVYVDIESISSQRMITPFSLRRTRAGYSRGTLGDITNDHAGQVIRRPPNLASMKFRRKAVYKKRL